MIADSLVALLRCPETGQAVRIAPEDLVRGLEARRAAGELRDNSGNVVAAPVEDGLLREDGARLFPVRGGIPVMLAEESIAISD